MKKNLLVAVVGNRGEEAREFFRELFSRQIKKGSRNRTITWRRAVPDSNGEIREVTLEMEVYHMWETAPSPLIALPRPLPRIVVSALPPGLAGNHWLEHFRKNDYYLYLICLNTPPNTPITHLDPINYKTITASCQEANGRLPAPEIRHELARKNLKDFMHGWSMNHLARHGQSSEHDFTVRDGSNQTEDYR